MKKYIYLLLLTGTIPYSYGQEVNSKYIVIAKNNTPPGTVYSEQYNNQILPITGWINDTAVIAFYIIPNNDSSNNVHDVVGYLLMPEGKTYSRILIDTFEVEGTQADILSVFLANADKDIYKELVILVNWHCRHYQIYGYIYETRIYDNIDTKRMSNKLTYLKEISEKVSGSFDGNNEGEEKHSKYKTAREIKTELKRLGY